MAGIELFNANLAVTAVTSGGTSAPSPGASETWTVTSSAMFGAAATGVSQFHVADTNVNASSEIITVTNVSGTTWTVTRGAESTTPVAHAAGFTVYQVATAGFLGLPPQWFNVRSSIYGAKGDGTTDDTAAIQAAINAAGVSGGVVYFPPGTYKTGTTLTISQSQPGITLQGAGMGQTYGGSIPSPVHPTTISYTGSNDAIQITGNVSWPSSGPAPTGTFLRDLAITGTSSARYGVSATSGEQVGLSHVTIDTFGTFGFYAIDVYYIQLDWVSISRCGTSGSSSPTGGANLTGGSGHAVNLILATNSIFDNNAGYGVYAVSPDTVTFLNCDFSDNTANAQAGSGCGVVCNGVGPFTFTGCWFEGNAGTCADGFSNGAVAASFNACYFATSTYGISNFGNVAVTACTFQGNTSGYSILDNQGYPLTWSSCYSTDSAGFIQGYAGTGYSTGGTWPVGVAAQRGQAYSADTGGFGAQPGLSGAITIQTFRGNVLNLFLSGNVTSSAFDINPQGQVVTVAWVQDSSGSRSYVWPSNCKFAGGSAPAASTTANFRDAVTFYCDGTNWYEVSRSAGIR